MIVFVDFSLLSSDELCHPVPRLWMSWKVKSAAKKKFYSTIDFVDSLIRTLWEVTSFVHSLNHGVDLFFHWCHYKRSFPALLLCFFLYEVVPHIKQEAQGHHHQSAADRYCDAGRHVELAVELVDCDVAGSLWHVFLTVFKVFHWFVRLTIVSPPTVLRVFICIVTTEEESLVLLARAQYEILSDLISAYFVVEVNQHS